MRLLKGFGYLMEEMGGSGFILQNVFCVTITGLFTSASHVLDNHYNQKLLGFFSTAFGVKSYPLVDYSKLWKTTKNTKGQLSNHECRGFRGFLMRQWDSRMEKIFCDNLVKLSVGLGSDVILWQLMTSN